MLKLSFASYNIRSVRHKSAYILDILATGTEILALQETWHESSDDIIIRSIVPDGYYIFEAARPSLVPNHTLHSRQWGGVAILYHDSFTGKQIFTLPSVTTFEYVAVELVRMSSRTIVLSVYRPGSEVLTDQFLVDMDAILSRLTVYKCPVLVMGDFNVHVELNDDPHVQQFLSLIDRLHLQQLVRCPTTNWVVLWISLSLKQIK